MNRNVDNKLNIRDFTPGDEEAAYYVCMKTGDSGKDGEPFYSDDPDALGRIYVGPYLAYEPKLALMLEDEQGVCGYAMAVLDSQAFFDRYERQWRPELCARFPNPKGDQADLTRLQQVYRLYHEPNYFCPEPYNEYPSHLHIDLLPRAQGRGMGRKMITELVQRLRLLGSPGVHLGLGESNVDAFGFYKAIGFTELCRCDGAVYMGMPISRKA